MPSRLTAENLQKKISQANDRCKKKTGGCSRARHCEEPSSGICHNKAKYVEKLRRELADRQPPVHPVARLFMSESLSSQSDVAKTGLGDKMALHLELPDISEFFIKGRRRAGAPKKPKFRVASVPEDLDKPKAVDIVLLICKAMKWLRQHLGENFILWINEKPLTRRIRVSNKSVTFSISDRSSNENSPTELEVKDDFNEHDMKDPQKFQRVAHEFVNKEVYLKSDTEQGRMSLVRLR
jgi:hypothetical protein